MRTFEVLKDWTTESGYRAVVIKGDLHHLCGYVGIEAENPLYKKGYAEELDVLKPFVDEVMNGDIGKRGVIPVFCSAFKEGDSSSMDIIFNVHGSVTFTNGGEGSKYPVESNLWWIGYDCGHSGDTKEVCDLAFCVSECEDLAKQIKRVEEEKVT